MKNKNRKLNKSLLLLIVSLVLVAAALITLGSCKKKEEIGESDVAAAQIAELLKGKLDTYQFVRSDKMSGDTLNVILSFAEILRDHGNETVNIVSDYERLAPVKDNEVIIGETTRRGTVYSDAEGVILQNESYTIQIIGTRLIISYTDKAGMIDGLEYLLFCLVDSEQQTIRDELDLKLFNRGVMRYEFKEFSLKNYIKKGAKLSASEDITFIGTSTPNSTVSVHLAKNNESFKSFDANTDANGVWRTSVTPDTQADSIIIKVDGKIAYGCSGFSFVEKEINSCFDGSKVYIDGKQVNVHKNDGGNLVIASLADASKTSMEVKIERSSKIEDCVIRPLSSETEPKISGKTVTFTVTEFPVKLSVEFEDFYTDTTDSVQLFLYDYEEFSPELSGRDLVYFAPGEYWEEENISISSNTTVYLAEGAILHARFYVYEADNVVVEGRGVIDTYYFKTEDNMMTFEKCENLTLKDYMLTGPRKWMTKLVSVNDCLIDAVNIVGTKVNSDGIDVVGCTDVTIQNCFIKSNDDCIAIKSWGDNVNNITMKNCVLWNLQYGNALEIGYETRCASITNVTFEDNDLIHVVSGACMSIHLGDRASVSGIRYKDIRIEDSLGLLIDLFIKDTTYTKDTDKGHISDIRFEGIKVYDDDTQVISLYGYDSEHIIENVRIEKIYQEGGYITKEHIEIQKNSFIEDIKYDNKAI